jgi:predicted HicB family RNase H-like nuclease
MDLKKKKKDTYCTNLRLPKKLAEKVKKIAENNNRSLNSEIQHALTQRYIVGA